MKVVGIISIVMASFFVINDIIKMAKTHRSDLLASLLWLTTAILLVIAG